MGIKNNYSPLRYPGGKAAIADVFFRLLDLNGISSSGTYVEPFAGGAGVALTLLFQKRVSNIIINDYDPCIASFWKSILLDTDHFIDTLDHVDISIETWIKQRKIYNCLGKQRRLQSSDRFKLGFATFFLNRCNRAGILPKAGPIGGMSQEGAYKLNARFKPQVLKQRIFAIAQKKAHIKFTSEDAIEFLGKLQNRVKKASEAFVYLDPPYYERGQELYLNAYTMQDHEILARTMNSFNLCPWVMTYDNCSGIRGIYTPYERLKIHTFLINYFMQNVRKAKEILICPQNIQTGIAQ